MRARVAADRASGADQLDEAADPRAEPTSSTAPPAFVAGTLVAELAVHLHVLAHALREIGAFSVCRFLHPHAAMLRASLLFLVIVGSSACVRVPAHQRGRLAAPAMQAPVWPEVTTGGEHVFLVREGTSGAATAGGGGCGCN